MTWRFAAAVRESRADVHVRRDEGAPRQVRIDTNIRRIALVVIECEETGRRGEIREAPIDRSVPVCRLIGIGQVSLANTPELGGANSELVALNQRGVDRQGYKDVRVADVVVIEEVLRFGVEVVRIDDPAIQRNCDAGLPFLVALTVQRQEAQIAVLRVLKERTTQCVERRSLIILSPKSAQDPIEARQSQRRADTRARGILGKRTVEMRLPYARGKLQPVRRFEGVLDVARDQRSGRALVLVDRRIAAVVEEDIE